MKKFSLTLLVAMIASFAYAQEVAPQGERPQRPEGAKGERPQRPEGAKG